MIYFTLHQEEEHTNSDLMMHSAAGQLDLEGKRGISWWAKENKQVCVLVYSECSSGAKRKQKWQGGTGAYLNSQKFRGEWYWDKGWWVVVCKFTLIVERRQHQEVLMCAFGKIVWKCFVLFRPRNRLRAGRDLKILSPKSYKTDDGWLY